MTEVSVLKPERERTGLECSLTDNMYVDTVSGHLATVQTRIHWATLCGMFFFILLFFTVHWISRATECPLFDQKMFSSVESVWDGFPLELCSCFSSKFKPSPLSARSGLDVHCTYDFNPLDRNYVFTSAIISRGSMFPAFVCHRGKEGAEHLHVCVCAGSVTWRRHVCFLAERPPLSVCVCMYMNELDALQQFPGSQGAAFSERHCMFTMLTHINSETYINILTYPEAS